MPPALLFLVIFQIGSQVFVKAGLELWSSNLCFLCIWDYRLASPHLSSKDIFNNIWVEMRRAVREIQKKEVSGSYQPWGTFEQIKRRCHYLGAGVTPHQGAAPRQQSMGWLTGSFGPSSGCPWAEGNLYNYTGTPSWRWGFWKQRRAPLQRPWGEREQVWLIWGAKRAAQARHMYVAGGRGVQKMLGKENLLW
jgi:hypothetical protein